MSEFVKRLNKNAVVALLYFVEGSGMGNEHSKLRCIYVGDSRGDIERQIIEDYKITGSLKDYLNRSWGSLAYYDNQVDAEHAVIKDTPPDKPTRVRLLQDASAELDYDTPCLRIGNHSYMHSPAKLGIAGDLKQGINVPKGTVFTVPFEYARWLTNSSSDEPNFEIVE